MLIRRTLLPHVDHVETVFEADGFAGVGTNKGFVAAAFSLVGHPLLFINCHMAARATHKRLRVRNQQYKTCVRKLRLGRVPYTDFLHQFTVFWMGDFNYRVYASEHWDDIGQSRDQVIAKLKATGSRSSIPDLLQYDQLTQQRQGGAVFCGFSESPPTFCPSYKYVSFSPKEQWKAVRTPGGS